MAESTKTCLKNGALDSVWPGLREIIDALPFFALLIDEDREILAANTAVKTFAGLAPAELVCGRCPGLIHRADEPLPGCPLTEAIQTNRPVEREAWDEQRQEWLLTSVCPTTFTTDKGRRVFLHFIREITRYMTVSDELERSLEHHTAVNEILRQVQNCQTSIEVLEVLVDQILSLSWMGLTTSAAGFLVEDDELNMVVRRNLNPILRSMCEVVPLGHCLCGKAAVSGEISVCTEVGHDHQVRYKGMEDHGHVLIPLKHGERVLAVLSFYLPAGEGLDEHRMDFLRTVAALAAVAFNRLQAQAKLVQTDRIASMGVLAAIVGHEIRTPLNVLSINLQMLERMFKAPGELKREKMLEKLRTISAEVQRIEGQLEGPLHALGRHEAADLQPISINSEVHSSFQFFDPEARRKHVRLTHDLTTGLPLVMVDAVKLRRILFNLILNGIQSAGEGGEVHLITGQSRAAVEVKIRDSGASSRFESGELEQLVNAGRSKTDQEGLGLAICARLARDIKARITVDASGDGTLFSISVPVG